MTKAAIATNPKATEFISEKCPASILCTLLKKRLMKGMVKPAPKGNDEGRDGCLYDQVPIILGMVISQGNFSAVFPAQAAFRQSKLLLSQGGIMTNSVSVVKK